MSILDIYPESWSSKDPVGQTQHFTGSLVIRQQLEAIGVQFETWEVMAEKLSIAPQGAILETYASKVEGLKKQHGFTTADVVSLTPEHADRVALRQKFLSEHTHSDFEVRFFVAGQGLFYIHLQDCVYALLCEKGDLISVPAGVRHWFDMGELPSFTCIRLFTDPAGWVAEYTGDPIAERFPLLEQFVTVSA